MQNRSPSIAGLSLLLAILISYGCSTSAVPTIRTTPTPTLPPERVYVSSSNGNIYAFNLPIAMTSTPVTTIAENGALGMAFDASSRLFVALPALGKIQVFTQPIKSGAAPAFTLKDSSNRGPFTLAFDPAGNLWTSPDGGSDFRSWLGEFAAPITSASKGTAGPSDGVFGGPIAIDRNGNLWEDQYLYGSGKSALTGPQVSFTHSYSGRYGCLAFDSRGNMFVGGQTGIDVYTPPFTSSSSPAFTVVTSSPMNFLAFDTSGNLYATTQSGSLLVFTPPLNATSSPYVTTTLPGTPLDLGLAIGP